MTFPYNTSQNPLYNPSFSISGEIDQGYLVHPPYKKRDHKANASLQYTRSNTSQTYSVPLFVNDLRLGISLSGSTAQSRTLRQFYAHNINLPEMTVTCQARSSYEYSYIAEFIRFTQYALTNNYNTASSTTDDNLVRFTLNSYKQKDRQGNLAPNVIGTKPSLSVTYRDPNTGKTVIDVPAANGGSMGNRMGFEIFCYITNVTRSVQVGQNAYEFQFTVEIVDKKYGLPFSAQDSGTTDAVEGVQWTYEQISSVPSGTFVSDPKVSVVNKKKKTPTTKSVVNNAQPQSVTQVVNQTLGSSFINF